MKLIYEHYLSLYGEPSRKARYETQDGKIVNVFKWDKSVTNEGVSIYATLGASEIINGDNESCEFFIGLTPEADSIAEALAELALHGNGTNIIPNDGDSLTLSYNLWEGTVARTFMFTDGDEIIGSIKNDDGKRIWFLQLVPLFDKELDYKKKFGEEALWEFFEENCVPYWDSERKSGIL
ncbi:suppressor of fused domain protein [Vibrio diabolicus]|uniref:suppressor of fused domain protein n=1 Tax=Vibrio harveyi group TaxID=717610 RepID=UPI002FEF2748